MQLGDVVKYAAGSARSTVSDAASRPRHDDVRLASQFCLDVLEIETESRYSCDCPETVFTLATSTMCATHKHLEMDHKPVRIIHIIMLMLWSFVTRVLHVYRADLRSYDR